jgi:hypothetical protein
MSNDDHSQQRTQAGWQQEHVRRQRDHTQPQSNPGQTAQLLSNEAQVDQTGARGAQTAQRRPRQSRAAQPQSIQAVRQLLHPSLQQRASSQPVPPPRQDDQQLHFINMPPPGEQMNLIHACAGQLVALSWELRSLGLVSQQEARILQVPTGRTAYLDLLRELEGILMFYEESRSPTVSAKRHLESERARLLTQLLKFTTAGLP